jgi:hypothetical protein
VELCGSAYYYVRMRKVGNLLCTLGADMCVPEYSNQGLKVCCCDSIQKGRMMVVSEWKAMFSGDT